ncbi:adenylate/guanylate cyclase domain-containing protein [Legionella spiritensis]|uniref:adenylate/guanylate cyclase domain-containing protein n=1 Tax=Legionella spiritensis TaxID=452 RepID=UPI000F6C9D35|nr:adenylate/guanylate cyclase domain-containing protein [Legionella spiritensis]VEG90246.1 adenylate cyclase [Legionella spiritensis]
MFSINRFKGMTISIRVSIITLFVLLLSLVGFSIISVEYLALDKILSASTKKLIEQSSLLVKERLHAYILPLNHHLIEMKKMIEKGVINPDNQKQLDGFFIETINDEPEVFMIYYGTVAGDFFGVDRARSGKLSVTHIINSRKPPYRINYKIDDQYKTTKSDVVLNHYDPRTRPWYRQAVEAGKPVWTDVYQFFVLSNQLDFEPGITAAAPVYNKQGQIQGVVAMDLTVDGLQKFIQKLDVTDNALILIMNRHRQIIAYHDPLQRVDLSQKTLDRELMEKYKLPFPSFNLENHQSLVTSFKKDGKDYFLAYQHISDNRSDVFWQIIIIVPADDVLVPLKKASLRTVLVALLILLIGIIIVRLISLRISRPIIQLAKDAQRITKLDLTPKPALKTIITEIRYLDKSLQTMRSSLTSFQRYVPSSLVKKLMRTSKIAEVGGENKNITVLFSDIKDFTGLSEKTDPKMLMNYLSEFFQSMTDSVIHHHGTLDKYIGDAVMAFWNAPLTDNEHARHACQSAMDMIAAVAKLNEKNIEKGSPIINIRIGIHSGQAVVGNVGSSDRLSYTALGDTVNMASRLETINKLYNTRVIVSHATFQQTEKYFTFRLIDEVAVRGKQESSKIYELITETDTPNLDKHKKEFLEAFAAYQSGKWHESLVLFKKLTPAYKNDPLAAVYIDRCQFLLSLPPEHWDGVWHVESSIH